MFLMKKFLLCLGLLCLLNGTYAQEIRDSLFHKVLVMLNDSTSSIQPLCCIIDVDYETKTPFTKKVGINVNERFFIFLISDPFADESFIMCRSMDVFDRTTNKTKYWIIGREHYNVLDDIIKNAKLKTLTDQSGELIGSIDWLPKNRSDCYGFLLAKNIGIFNLVSLFYLSNIFYEKNIVSRSRWSFGRNRRWSSKIS